MPTPGPTTRFRLFATALGAGLLLPAFAAAQACPDYNAPANTTLTLTADQLGQPQVIEMVAGGDVSLGNCSHLPGYGHVVTGPDYHLVLSGTQPGTSLAVRVQGECDTVLLANDFNGEWLYDDDSGENWLDPELILPARDGAYDFWVGTWESDLCRASFSLQVAPTATLSPCPDPTLPPAHTINFSTSDLAQEQRFDVVAGGDMQLGRCASLDGWGMVVNYPDFVLNLDAAAGVDLNIGLEGLAGCDTVLVVNDSGGNWHYNDDDNSGDDYTLSSRINLRQAEGGQYHIWAGTWDDELCYATLILSAQPGLTKPGMGGG